VQAFALISDLGGDEAVELFVREWDAVLALEAALRDMPKCVGVLAVEPVDLAC
jgi:hypothetical protein